MNVNNHHTLGIEHQHFNLIVKSSVLEYRASTMKHVSLLTNCPLPSHPHIGFLLPPDQHFSFHCTLFGLESISDLLCSSAALQGIQTERQDLQRDRRAQKTALESLGVSLKLG